MLINNHPLCTAYGPVASFT